MTRDLTTLVSDSLDKPVVSAFFAVDIDFDAQPLYVWNGVGDFVIDGKTYLGAGQLLSISTVEETTEMEAKGASLTLSGIPSQFLAAALTQPYQGRECRIYFGVQKVPAADWILASGFWNDFVVSGGVSAATLGQNYSVSSQVVTPSSLFFNSDGTKSYVLDQNGGRDVNEYSLSSPWDLSTAVYSSSFSVSSREFLPTALFFKPDGTKMYVTGAFNLNVNEYDLSTPWSISSAVYVRAFTNLYMREQGPQGLFISTDGSKMYVVGSQSDSVITYNLTTPWDVSSAVYVSNFYVSTQDTSPSDISFSSDGKSMYISGKSSSSIHRYSLETAWNLSSTSYAESLSVVSQDASPSGVFVTPDDSKIYVLGESTYRIYQYDFSLGVPAVWYDTEVWNDNFVTLSDYVEVFTGELDQMNILEAADTATIQVTAENVLVRLERPVVRRFTDQDQKSRYPGDRGLEFIAGLQDKEIFWGRTAK